MKNYSDILGSKGGLTQFQRLEQNVLKYGVRDSSGNVIVTPEEVQKSMQTTQPQLNQTLSPTILKSVETGTQNANTNIETGTGTSTVTVTNTQPKSIIQQYLIYGIVAIIAIGVVLYLLFRK